MNWLCPLGDDFRLQPTENPESFRVMPWWPHMTTGIPYIASAGHIERVLGGYYSVNIYHPGAFGAVRKRHIHEGVDLYCPRNTIVRAVEAGRVVAIEDFTGEDANPPSPWWNNTKAVLVEGESGVVVYGEIWLWENTRTSVGLEVGSHVERGDVIGFVDQVLKVDKGRPMSMLHLELHVKGTRQTFEWTTLSGRPASLLDPTMYLVNCVYE